MNELNALFVETDGVYFDLANITPWDIKKNAFNCKNGAPAICHPPCKRWGRYAKGGPSSKKTFYIGDDGGCFAYALWYVRTFGGIIEHPEGSHAYNYYGIKKPRARKGWVEADNYNGYVCSVAQGNYGHPSRKMTWLYINGIEKRELNWGIPKGLIRMDDGVRSKEHGIKLRSSDNYKTIQRITKKQRMDTPIEFRDLLIGMCHN